MVTSSAATSTHHECSQHRHRSDVVERLKGLQQTWNRDAISYCEIDCRESIVGRRYTWGGGRVRDKTADVDGGEHFMFCSASIRARHFSTTTGNKCPKFFVLH